MVGLLVRLKLRLLGNALRSSVGARVAFIFSTIVAALVAAGAFVGLAALRGNAASVDLTTVVFTLFAFGWVIVPLLIFGVDATLDPATLALYPLRTWPLALGLLAASATGAWPLANVLGLAGVLAGLAHGPLGLLAGLVAVIMEVLFSITLSRFVTTGLARLLRSRRGRDLAALLIIPIFAGYETFTQLVPKLAASGELTASRFSGVDSWLRWLPPGLAAHAIQDASGGHLAAAAGRLAVLAACTAGLAAWWIRLLGRALVTADTSTQSASVHGQALPFARHGLRGTVAARFWVYQRREPYMFIYWGLTVVIMAAVSISTIRTASYLTGLMTSAVFVCGFMAFFHANAIGTTGPGFGIEALALPGRRELRAYFSGQNVALALIALPVFAVVSFAQAAVAGHPLAAFLALAADLAGIGAGLGLANIWSVILAFPAEKRPGLPFPRAADGYNGQAVGSALGSLATVAALITPVIIAVVATEGSAAALRLPALVAAGAAYGAFLCWAGVQIAAVSATARLPELSRIAARSRL